MKLPNTLTVFLLSPLLFVSCAHVTERPTDRLRAAGTLQGAYQDAMQSIAKLPGNPGKIELVAESSPGSKVTLRQIRTGKVDVGIVQGDTDFSGSNAGAVRALYDEIFFVVSKTPAGSLKELAGKVKGHVLRIGGLPKGSQTEIDCRRILADNGIGQFEYVGADHVDTIAHLKTEVIDAAIFVTGAESKTLDPIRHDASLHLMAVNAVPWKGVGYTTIPAGAVLRHAPAMKTLYTPSLLAASNDSPVPLVSVLAKTLDKNRGVIRAAAPFVSVSKVPAELGVPLHSAAK